MEILQKFKGILKMTWKDLSRLLVEHNHPSNEPLLEVIVCWSQVKAAAKAGREKARSISNWSAAAHNNILSESTCKKTLRNQKSGGCLLQPKLLNELVIQDLWKNTQWDTFLLFNNGRDANSRIFTFVTGGALWLLCDASTWLMEGNFQMDPKYFMQLYIILVPFEDITMLTVYCFLQK